MQTLRVDLGQAKCFIKFAVGQQSGVGGDLAPQELELQAAVKTDSQIVVIDLSSG